MLRLLADIFVGTTLTKLGELTDTANLVRAVSSAGLEQGTSNSQVGGSSPPRLANFCRKTALILLLRR